MVEGYKRYVLISDVVELVAQLMVEGYKGDVLISDGVELPA